MKKFFLFSLVVFGMLAVVSCKDSKGEKAEVSEATEASTAVGTDLAVNTATSQVMWEGSKPTGTHTGTLAISSGTVAIKDGSVTGGSFVIDMNSLTVTDLEGDYKAGLESHLKGTDDKKADDFFNVNKYPTAAFEITKVTRLEGDAAANSMVYGNLTMKDQTKQVGFKANITVANGGVTVDTPEFTINRTEWGITYGSPSFFEGLKDKAISDEMVIKIKLNAAGQSS